MPYRNSFVSILRFALLCLTILSGSVQAIITPWITSPGQPDAKVRLLLSGETNPVNNTVVAALQIQLDSPWKTYWRSPGEAGIPPVIRWQNDTQSINNNLLDSSWLWPIPERFELLGLNTLGYQGNVVFPLFLQVRDIDSPVEVNGFLRLSSCTTVCLLNDYPLNLTFTPSDLKPDAEATYLIDKALSRVPAMMPDTGIDITSVDWNPKNNQVVVNIQSDNKWVSPDVILDGLDDISFGLPDIRIDSHQLQAVFTASSWLGDIDLSNQFITVTVLNGTDAKEASIAVSKNAVTLITSHQKNALVFMLFFAFSGGLILNLMPCVLPVLGLKLSSVIQASGQSATRTRYQFLSSAAGIVFSFWLLAVFLIFLKWTGNSVGWGIQFQNPWFIGFMVIITGLFAANLLGSFEIQIPSSLSTRLAAGDNGVADYFLQGMFATLLATPCSAPFLGTAIAFALTTGTLNLLAVFTAMGIGLALPYLLIACRPGLLNWLPKPGQWMVTLRRILATLLMLTTLWLISLLKVHLDLQWLVALMFTVTSGFSALLLTRLLSVKRRLLIIPSLCLALFVSLIWGGFAGWLSPSTSDQTLKWQPFSVEAIDHQIAQGKTVFVDITADWCVTCKANKLRVLDRDPVYSALQADNIVLLQGDWSRPSNTINRYLEQNNRFGVPFNKVYGPKALQGINLSVILDHNTVLQALSASQFE